MVVAEEVVVGTLEAWGYRLQCFYYDLYCKGIQKTDGQTAEPTDTALDLVS